MTFEQAPRGSIAPEKGSAAEELEYRLRQQQLAAEYALFALRTHDVQSLLQEASRVCAQALQSRMSKVMEYLPEEDRFLVRAGVGWQSGIVGEARTGADEKSPTGYAFRTGSSVVSDHLTGESRFRTPRILAEHGVKRAINAVIQCGGERFGVLEVDSPVEGRFTEADLLFVTGLANLLGVALERQRFEEALRRKEELLEKALEHQKVLADEIGHRVKNSLAIVAGLLSMQARASPDTTLRQALDDAQARVQAIARIHDRLRRKEDVGSVNLAEFLGDLCRDCHASAPRHELVQEIAPVTLATDQAISLGLISNELITNALKYAYPEGSGRVVIKVAEAGDGLLRFEVCDEGVGIEATAGSAAPRDGLGRRVIATLSRHLGGTPEWQDADPGTRFVLTFRPEAPAY
ncbi:histidine kinase dimerization/phosphoacceptor domain -containing protein [Chelativorans sp.]|uniref:sensor histidine kinase n=1 Tax=Chelativorans sp. TaxID=2203393 RepID=UPI002810B4D3|nr:histidine kinase dimerization/phosphoacceptor domain -containing protein [Chelativorans sp.]